jgi:hypothetical protein
MASFATSTMASFNYCLNTYKHPYTRHVSQIKPISDQSAFEYFCTVSQGANKYFCKQYAPKKRKLPLKI